MTLLEKKFISFCSSLLGENAVLVSDQDKLPYLTDWRKRYIGEACCVLFPQTVNEVSTVVKYAQEHGIALVPQGGNTGLSGGAVPFGKTNEAILNLKKLSRFRYFDQINQTVTVDSGCVLSDIQEFAKKNGLFFPLSLGSEGSCTIGGNLATNAGGVNVIHYGNTRSLCLGLEVVLASGKIWNGMRQLHKDNSGYALKEIFIGSEGKLGVITGAVLKLFPKPTCLTAFVALPSFQSALHIMNRLRSEICTPLTAFELISNNAIQVVQQHYNHYLNVLEPKLTSCIDVPYFALIECIVGKIGDSEKKTNKNKENIFECLIEMYESKVIQEVWIAQNDHQAKNLWHIRESIPLAQAKNGLNVKHDISLPISMIGKFVKNISRQLSITHPGSKIIHFGHLGDGNLHFNVAAPENIEASTFLKQEESSINHYVYEEVDRCRGSFSAEHGIGQLKTNLMMKYKSPEEIDLMKKLKFAWDPNNLFNPGKL